MFFFLKVRIKFFLGDDVFSIIVGLEEVDVEVLGILEVDL